MNVIKESIAFCKVLRPIKKFEYPTRRLKLTGRYQKVLTFLDILEFKAWCANAMIVHHMGS